MPTNSNRVWTSICLTTATWCVFFSLVTTTLQGQDDKKQAAARSYNAAAELQNTGVHDRAVLKWHEFTKTYPNDERIDRAHYYLGVCQLRMGKFSEAATSFQTVISKWPQFSKIDGAYFNQAMAYYELALASNKPDDFRKAATA